MSDIKQIGYLISEAPDPYQMDLNYHSDVLSQSNDEVVIKTILQTAESLNRNKRIYTKEAIESGLRSPIIQEKMKHKNWFGENAHPLCKDIERQTFIDPDKKSHIIEDIFWKGNTLYGIVATANTRAGRDLAGLINQGCVTPFSMRGLAGRIVKNNGIVKVLQPLHIITYDKVDIPSHPEAYQVNIIKNEFKLSNEGLLEEVALSEIIDYIKEESNNVKEGIDQLDLDSNSIILSEDYKSISIKGEDGTFKLFTEEDISSEIDKFMKNL